MSYLKSYGGSKQTPQSEPIPGRADMVKNSAGGYTFEIDKWARLERFLVLGSEGGSYYAGEMQLTRDNANNLLNCIREDGPRTIRTIVDMSHSGRIPKNDTAIFALALAAAEGDHLTRRFAYQLMPKVVRTGAHLLQFASFSDQFRGWGRGIRNAVADWYHSRSPRELAYQVAKYRSRGGGADAWSQHDVLQMAHVRPDNEAYDRVFRWVTNNFNWSDTINFGKTGSDLRDVTDFMMAFDMVQKLDHRDVASRRYVIEAITNHGLTWEMIPDHFRKHADVWAALLENMPMTAMIRNLANMTRVGLLKPMSDASNMVVERLRDRERLRNARVHPIWLLNTLRTYTGGSGLGRGGMRIWDPVTQIVDALDDAFYLAFDSVEPTGKRHMLALDVSGSMGFGEVAGTSGITPREASGALALLTANVEKQYQIMAFARDFVPANISPGQRLDDVLRTIQGIPMGGTDCSLPMRYALKNEIPVDVFLVITDSETWAGREHPVQALRKYRERMGIDAKLAVMALQANPFSIADPNDAGMLDLVGFDTATPTILSNFVTE